MIHDTNPRDNGKTEKAAMPSPGMPPHLQMQIQPATQVQRATLSQEAMVYLQRRGSFFGR